MAGDEAWACDPEPRPFPSPSLGDCRAVTLEEFCDLLLLYEFLDVSGWVRCGDCGERIDSESGYVAYLDESLDLCVFHNDSESNKERVSAELDALSDWLSDPQW